MRPPRSILALVLALNLLITLAAIAHGYIRSPNHNPSRYFGEGRWPLAVSCLQMLLVAFFAFRTYGARKLTRMAGDTGFRVWALIGAGFVFLAADDALQIHEEVDHWLHRTFHLPNDGLTDRIDDAIIASYGVIGLCVLWAYRRELLQFRPMLWPLGVGFFFSVLSVGCDTISNRRDAFVWLGAEDAFAQVLEGWFAAAEGGFQLLALGAFVAAFYLAWRRALDVSPTLKSEGRAGDPGAPL